MGASPVLPQACDSIPPWLGCGAHCFQAAPPCRLNTAHYLRRRGGEAGLSVEDGECVKSVCEWRFVVGVGVGGGREEEKEDSR